MLKKKEKESGPQEANAIAVRLSNRLLLELPVQDQIRITCELTEALRIEVFDIAKHERARLIKEIETTAVPDLETRRVLVQALRRAK